MELHALKNGMSCPSIIKKNHNQSHIARGKYEKLTAQVNKTPFLFSVHLCQSASVEEQCIHLWVLFLHPKRRAVHLESPPRFNNSNTFAPALHRDYYTSEQMTGLSVLWLEGLRRLVGLRSGWKNWPFSSLLRDVCQMVLETRQPTVATWASGFGVKSRVQRESRRAGQSFVVGFVRRTI